MTQEHNYYKMSIDETLKALNSRLNGLTEEEVKSRYEKFGANELKEKKKNRLGNYYFLNLIIYLSIY
jgi:magnesium-transporting ATPase (P-type)